MKSNNIPLEPSKIPESLRGLIPYAERFGVSGYVDVVHAPDLTADDMLRFWMAVQPHAAEIHRWLDAAEKSPETIAFLYMMQALNYADPDCEAQETQRRHFWETHLFPKAIRNACRLADEAFQRRDYRGVVAALSPYERHLDPVHAAKLKYAKTHASVA